MLASKEYRNDARKSFDAICDAVFENDEGIAKYCKEYNIPF